MRGILLFGHGSRTPAWASPFHAIRDAITAKTPDVPVALGFLEAMRPTLDEGIAELVAVGVEEIDVVPIFLASGNHILRDLPQLAAAAMERHAGLVIRVAAPAGEAPLVIDAMAAYALQSSNTKS